MSGPHSNFVASVLSEIELAREFFTVTLPTPAQALVDLRTLRLESGTFVDDRNRIRHTDLLYTVRRITGEDLKLYILFEHVSAPRFRMLDQLLEYLVRIYQSQKQAKSPVLVVVFYHGRRPWRLPLEYQATMALSRAEKAVLSDRLLNFRYSLVNVGRTDIDGMTASPRQKAFWWTLKGIWGLKTATDLRNFLLTVKDYFGTIPLSFLEILLGYILQARQIEPELLRNLFAETISKERAHIVMTPVQKLAEKAKQEGFETGLQEGQLKGKLEDAKNLLENGVSLEIILKSTGLTTEQLQAAGILK